MRLFCISRGLLIPIRYGVFTFFSLLYLQSEGLAQLEEPFEAPCSVEESSELYEALEDLRAHPLDVNRASSEELAIIPWITPTMAKNAVRYREEKGLFERADQLINVDGFSAGILEMILPYLRAGKPSAPVKRDYRIRSRVSDRHPAEEGYVGSSMRMYTRGIAVVGERLSVCVLAEKDPYEEKFLDLLSSHVSVKNAGCFESSVLGDYSLDFAEGLVFGPPRFMVKGSGVTKGSERGVVPNRSTSEAHLMKGAATAVLVKNVRLYGFLSYAKLDATIDDEGLVTTLYEEGLHRTPNEVAKIDRLQESLIGGRAVAAAGGLRLGLTGCSGRYEPGFARSTTPYYVFSGDRYRVVGADLEIGAGSTEFFCEFAKSLPLGHGCLIGLTHKVKNANMGVLLRHYDEDFYSPHSSAICNSRDENEEGAYIEAGWKIGRTTKLSGYIDIFRTLAPSYGIFCSSSGRDYRARIEQRLTEKLRLSARVHLKGREESNDLEEIHFKDRRGIRAQADFTASKNASLRVRIETVASVVEDESTSDTGSLLFWEIALKPVPSLSLRGRLTVFDVDSWDARLYQYESDLPGVMRNVAVSGKGTMGFALLGLKLSNWFKLTGKFSWKRSDGEEEWGFGTQSDIDLRRPGS